MHIKLKINAINYKFGSIHNNVNFNNRFIGAWLNDILRYLILEYNGINNESWQKCSFTKISINEICFNISYRKKRSYLK